MMRSDADIANSVCATNQPLMLFLKAARIMRLKKHRSTRREFLNTLGAFQCVRETGDPEVVYHLVFTINVALDTWQGYPNGPTTALICDTLLRMVREVDPTALTIREHLAQMSDYNSPPLSPPTNGQWQEMELLYPPPTEARLQQWANEFEARRADSSEESDSDA